MGSFLAGNDLLLGACVLPALLFKQRVLFFAGWWGRRWIMTNDSAVSNSNGRWGERNTLYGSHRGLVALIDIPPRGGGSEAHNSSESDSQQVKRCAICEKI